MSDVYVGAMFSDAYLEHHGIKGMRWGVRHDRYPLNASEHTSAEKKAGWRSSLTKKVGAIKKKAKRAEDNYVKLHTKRYLEQNKKYGMTKEDAEIAARNRAKLLKKVAIGAGLAVGTAAGIYIASQLGRNYCDNIIKAGTTIQTLSADPDRMNKGEAFFTAYRNSDKLKYAGQFGSDATIFGVKNKNKLQAVAENNIRIAGSHNAKKVFNELMKNDEEFKKAVENNKFTEIAKIRDMGNKSAYELFNTYDLLGSNPDHTAQKKFYEALKKKGYGAVADVNDRKYSGFNTRAAIVFDRSGIAKDAAGKVAYKSVDALTDKEKEKGMKFSVRSSVAEALMSPGMVATGATYLGSYVMNDYERKVKRQAMKKAEKQKEDEKNKEKGKTK